jgi:hypothetical protein
VDFLARSLGGWEPPATSLTQTYGIKSPRKHTREVHVATCSLQVGAGLPGLRLALAQGAWPAPCP